MFFSFSLVELRRCLQCDKLTLENTGTKDQTDSSSSSTKHHTTTTTSIDRLRSPSLVNPLTWILHEIWHNRACRADLDTNWYQLIRSTTLYLLIKELFNWLVSLTGDKGERCRLLVFMFFFLVLEIWFGPREQVSFCCWFQSSETIK